ncbi:IclR family transcriptional regulator [Streptomyces sp. NPDC056600]|uniref:IclR family transcriptional regulator n=1 Tax=Streptomyces sp. NPDC056600 TaxID=3345874 RepID=UPI0036C90392
MTAAPQPAAPSGTGAQALERGLAILTALADGRRPLGLVELADATGLSKSTCHRYVASLVALRYLEQEDGGRKYLLGPAAMHLGMAAVGTLDVARVGARSVQALADETNHTVSLTVLDGADIVYVDRRRPSRAGFRIELNVQIGTRLPAYCTSMGKVLLAYRDPASVRAVLDRIDLARRGPRTITAREELVAALAEIRRTGLALNDQELTAGLRSVAVPVRDRHGNVCAALGVAVHLSAWNATAEAVVTRLEGPLRHAAQEISRRMGHLE